MLKSTKRLSLLMALLMLVSLFTACKKDVENPSEGNTDTYTDNKCVLISNGVSERSYQIVRSEQSTKEEMELSIALAEYIKEATGYDIPVTTDFEKGSYTTRTDYEILIGKTNRDESKEFDEFTYRDWAVSFKGTRVAICGGGFDALCNAVRFFEESFINAESRSVEMELGFEKIYTHAYLASNVTLAGNKLDSYVIVSKAKDESAEYLQSAIANYTSEVLDIVTGTPTDKKAIVIGKATDKATELLSGISFDEYLIQLDADGTVYIGNNNLSEDNSYAVGKFVLDVLGYDIANDTSAKSGAIEISPMVLKEKIMNDTFAALTIADTKYLDELDAKSNALKSQILNSANTVDTSKWSGKIYYVSNDGSDSNSGTSPDKAWKTLSKVNSTTFSNGTAVLFARGDTWRGCLIARAGVTYSSYGTGEKPQIYGSPENGTGVANWSLLSGTTNIWVYSKQLNDVGAIVFNEGSDSENFAYKVMGSYSNGKYLTYTADSEINESTMKDVLKNDLYFFSYVDSKKDGNGNPKVSDLTNKGKLYLRCDKGNPGEVFNSIEFCTYADPGTNATTYGHIVNVPANLNGNPITIDNICIKFGGVHGIGGGDNEGLTVTNCEIGWIGGTVHAWNKSGDVYKPVALGNAVEVTRNCVDFTVSNNWIYQCYDTGITNQTSNSNGVTKNQNIKYDGNLIDYCDMSIEIWYGGINPAPSAAVYGMRNVQVTNNICRFIGYGICEYRPNYAVGGGIQTAWGGTKLNNKASDYVIKNNTFFVTNGSVQTIWIVAGDSAWLPDIEGNTYVDIYGYRLGMYYVKTAEDLKMSYADHFSDYNYDENIAAVIKDTLGDSNGTVAVIDSFESIKNRYKHMIRDTWHQGVPQSDKY